MATPHAATKTFSFTSERDYEAFQFIWIGLNNTTLGGANPRRVSFHNLMTKLARISKPFQGGRVLKGECAIELTPDELIVAVESLLHVQWNPEVYREVRRAFDFLGAEFEPTGEVRTGV